MIYHIYINRIKKVQSIEKSRMKKYYKKYYNIPNTVFLLSKSFDNKYNIGMNYIRGNNGVISTNDPYNDTRCFDFNNTFLTLDTGFNLRTNDFTIDYWECVKVINLNGSVFNLSYDGNSCCCGILSILYSNGYNIYLSSNGSSWYTTNPTIYDSADVNIWKHFAFVRKNEYLNIFINGIKKTSITVNDFNMFNSNVSYIGVYRSPNYGGTNYSINSYLDNVRIINGTCLWDSDFNPPPRF